MKSDLKIISFGGELGDQIIVEIIPHRDNIRHSIVYGIKNAVHQEDIKLGATVHLFSVPLRWAMSIRDSASSMLSISLSTYEEEGSVYLGSSELSLPINVPLDVKPIIDNVEVLPINPQEAESWSIYIQRLSRAAVKTTARGVLGSVIKHINVSMAGTNYTGDDVLSHYFAHAGNVEVTVRVTDSRGRMESLIKTISVRPYNYPIIRDISIKRCNSEGIEQEDGNYINIGIDHSFTNIEDYTQGKITLYYKESAAQNYDILGDYEPTTTYGSFNINKSYDIKAVASDGLNQSEHFAVIPSSNITININPLGNAIAFGCLATRENSVEIAPDWQLWLKGKRFLDCIYPLGSVYISSKNISPQSLFGGVWRSVEGRFLLGANEDFVAGSTGGSFTHSLKINEMPRHRHTNNSIYEGNSSYPQLTGQYVSRVWKTAYGVQDTSSYSGEGEAHSITPPYYSVYMWERIE